MKQFKYFILGCIIFTSINYANNINDENHNVNINTIIDNNNSTINIYNNDRNINYIESDLSKNNQKYIFEFPQLKNESFSCKYTLSLNGKISIPKKFIPFRVEVYSYNIDNMEIYSYPQSMNSIQPFYETKKELNHDDSFIVYPIYKVYYGEDSESFVGMVYRLWITNIMDGGEDIIIKNSLVSKIKRISNLKRMVASEFGGGMGDTLKLNKKILLKEGTDKLRFNNADFITIRAGETIVIDVPYTPYKTGLYDIQAQLKLTYAGADGLLNIELPNIAVPEIIGWIDDGLAVVDKKNLNEYKEVTPYINKKCSQDIYYWLGYDLEKRKYEDLSYSSKKLSKDDITFLGVTNARYLRNDVFAKRGYTFKEKSLNEFFKGCYKKTDMTYNEILNDLTEVEKWNIELSLKVEKELK